MKQIVSYFILTLCLGICLPVCAQQKPLLLNMVHHNPGEAATQSRYLDPAFLKSRGYDANVFFLFDAAQFGINWQMFDKNIFPAGTDARRWVDNKAEVIAQKYQQSKRQHLQVYCMLDMLVLPKALADKYKDSICNDKGKIDISKPFTQRCVRYLLNQMFDRFPQLDGLVIRTGETYLHDAPFYTGNSPLLHSINDHVTLLKLLREEVCIKRNKNLIYRTWDFGQLHSLPKYYLQITNQIAPHPKLYFSVKHTMVDFWRGALPDKMPDYNQFDAYWINEANHYGVPFNPCLGIGSHKQIVEVQCQREYEGKGAFPNYIANGVINGFAELKGKQAVYSLNQFKHNKRYAGVWTWARGGGWGGPHIGNEFWCELNADVLAKWTKNAQLSEPELFARFARLKGLPEKEIKWFHQLCLLSDTAVLQGQYSALGNDYILWTRDNSIAGLPMLKPFFEKIISQHQEERYIQEKQHAVDLWRQIEALSRKLHFKDPQLCSFVQVSCTYGRIRQEIMSLGYEIMLKGYAKQRNSDSDYSPLAPLITRYDQLWIDWEQLKATHPDCPELYQRQSDYGYEGLDKSVSHFRMAGLK